MLYTCKVVYGIYDIIRFDVADVKDFTTIGISKKVWKALNSKKEVGESFDRLLIRLLDLGTGAGGEAVE